MNVGEIQKSLPKCPACGNTPEFALKADQFGWNRGGIKCPYDHYRAQLESPASSKEKAIELLAPMWTEMVRKIKEGEAE
ncbi:hypothetical protein FP363_10330 [Escherichia coli]|jgi:hypothetical protein|uniref:hypothetical protein n=1 Tax=Escherichia coli TaxID=562 RepID=UPI001C96BF68|nr:hypothetical protein [Escherichia coli]MBY5190993.1 hypothetical protein [Escherichia coli]